MSGKPTRRRRSVLLLVSFAAGTAGLVAIPAYADEMSGPIWFSNPLRQDDPGSLQVRQDAQTMQKAAETALTGTSTAEQPIKNRTVVYLVAHQDDEVLSLGASVANDVMAGAQVKMVSVYDGAASGARERLCSVTQVCLSPEQFATARRNEFKAAVARLGVPAESVFFDTVQEDTGTPQTLLPVVEKYVNQFGRSALFRTMSFMDVHRDHYSLGYALEALCQKHALSDCEFFQSDLYRVNTGIHLGHYGKVPTPRGRLITPTPLAASRLRDAMDEYKIFDIAQERYAIGWTYSVPRYFAYALTHPEDWAHGPRSQWMNAEDRAAAETWIAKYQAWRGTDLLYPSQSNAKLSLAAWLKAPGMLPGPRPMVLAKTPAKPLGKTNPAPKVTPSPKASPKATPKATPKASTAPKKKRR